MFIFGIKLVRTEFAYRCDIQVVGHCQLDRISFAAEGTSGINRYFDSSVCCLLNLFRDFLCAFSIRGGLRVN